MVSVMCEITNPVLRNRQTFIGKDFLQMLRLLWKLPYFPTWWLVALSRWREVHPANSAFTLESPDSLQHCVNPVYHRNVGMVNLYGTVMWWKESSQNVISRSTCFGYSFIHYQITGGNAHESLYKLTSLNFITRITVAECTMVGSH